MTLAVAQGNVAMPIPPRDAILAIRPYVVQAGPVTLDRATIDLSGNESPFAPSPAAIAAFGAIGARLNRYPDSGAAPLCDAIGAKFDLDPTTVVCGAGSETLLDLIVRCYAGAGDEVLFPQYSFPMYPTYTRAAGAIPIEAPAPNYGADLDALLSQVTGRTRVLILANPNNPTGTWLDRVALRQLRAALRPDVLLVIDAAYAEYVTDAEYDPGHELLGQSPENVIVTRTLSKAYGLGALRVGWAHAANSFISVLNRVRPVFAVGAASIAAGVAALGDDAHLAHVVAHNAHWHRWLCEQLNALGFRTPPNARGNFVLGVAPPHFEDAEAVAAGLLRHGIRVRPVSVPRGVRISIGAEAEMHALGAALVALCDQAAARARG